MAKFKPEKDSFRLDMAMHYLNNMLRYFKGPICDNDVFRAPAALTTRAEWREWFETAVPESVRKQLAQEDHDRDAICFRDYLPELIRCFWCHEKIRPQLRKKLQSLKASGPARGKDAFRARFGEFCDLLRLKPVERDVLLVRYLMWADLLDWPLSRMRDNRDTRIQSFAMFADRSIGEVRAALSQDAPLMRYGCLDSDLDFNTDVSGFFDGTDTEPLANRMFSRDAEKPLPWDWFGKTVEKHGPILCKLLAPGAGRANVLLYGAPGTGKTSLARALAARTGRQCWFVAQDPEDDSLRGPSGGLSGMRFAALRAANNRVDPATSLLVVDEADDMLRGAGHGLDFFSPAGRGGTAGREKGLLNSVMDELRVPVVWISNASPAEMDESSRRRFDYSIRFEALTDGQRAAVWRNQVAKTRLGRLVDGDMAAEFASRWPVSAGGVASVLRNVARVKPSKSEVRGVVESLMEPHCRLLGIEPSDDRLRPARDYSLDGLNIASSVPLARIVAAARAFRDGLAAGKAARGPDQPRFNLLLSGPPGTGKTEFAKHLAAELGAKLSVRMCSDLVSPWVGMTEKNIAAAFRQAESEDAVLFLDEADGLLRSRGSATHSWEVTQVNELLHRMENFRGILVCSTNFADDLDPATTRRFTFKVAFDWLTGEGKAAFFGRFFGKSLSEAERAELDAIPDLAPGDFRTVRQGRTYLGGGDDVPSLLRALREESDAKRFRGGRARGRLGF